ncbi:uncharacterized protein TNCV_3406341 [Trichonephila clavipes]|nr:uncharacterized protein TNCV_3406341 [Trichonephila clavipes]
MQMYTVLSQEKTTSPYFQGVYSRDTLPPLQENMCAIVNSDDSSQPGTHWLALFVNDKRELEFYDSFGQPPVFYNISTTTYLDVLWNSKVFQSPTSNNRRDQSQITHLGRQLYPRKVKFFMQECYADATSKPYGYLLIDLKPETDESLRVRTGMFPGDVFYVYQPR